MSIPSSLIARSQALVLPNGPTNLRPSDQFSLRLRGFFALQFPLKRLQKRRGKLRSARHTVGVRASVGGCGLWAVGCGLWAAGCRQCAAGTLLRVPPYPPTHGIVLSSIIKVLSVFPPSLDDRWRYAMARASVLLVLAPVVVVGGCRSLISIFIHMPHLPCMHAFPPSSPSQSSSMTGTWTTRLVLLASACELLPGRQPR